VSANAGSASGRARSIARLASVLAAVLLLAACATPSEKPTPLAKRFVNRVRVQTQWGTRVRGEAPNLRLGLDIAEADGRLFVANYKGEVRAFDAASGRPLWRRRLKAPLAGGPGAGGDLVVIGSSKGEVIALRQADGAVRWRVRINSEILSAPAVSQDMVLIRAVDGRLHGLSSSDGSESWVIDQEVPRLSLRGTSQPLFAGDLAICGFDNGRVLAALRRNGTTAWDVSVGQAHGSTELARLIDVDAPVVADGDDLFAIAYQGRLARIERDTGRVLWTHDISSYRGFAVDAQALYVATAEGDVVRLDRQNGAELWRQKALEHRQLSAPALYSGRLVLGDLQGFVHWIDPANGALVARARIGKAPVRAAPIVSSGLVVVFSDGGDLRAFRTPAAPVASAAVH
jgi:outer membrane protein assembly factor BamB